MNKVMMYAKLQEVYDGLEYLVKPVVREDIRSERNKIREVMEILKQDTHVSGDEQ